MAKNLWGNRAGLAAGNKFGVSPVEDRKQDGIVFDSKLEKGFYNLLTMLLPGHEIRRQVRFTLQSGFRPCHDGKVVRGIHYRADFVLGPLADTPDGPVPLPGCMVIDAKGMETQVFGVVSRMFHHKFGHQIRALHTQKALKGAIAQYLQFMNVNQFIIDRATDGAMFRVLGYQRSDGSVVNLTVRCVGHAGYLALVRESLRQLETLAAPEWDNADELAQWVLAKHEIAESLRRSLGEGDTPENVPAKVSHETLEPLCDGLALLNGSPDHVVVFRLETLDTELVAGGTANAAKSRNTKSEFKKTINRGLAVSRYCHRLNLYTGKFERLEACQ